MSNESQVLLVHQLLHGYQEGHTLISSSLNLDPENRRMVGVLTDMSGPTMQRGFEEYISGFALASEGYYAISKTWYAAEMPRAGSVWTHTLLIAFSDLPKLENANDIIKLFRRPSIHDKDYKSNYKAPIQLYSNTYDEIYWGISDPAVCKTVMRGLYDLLSPTVIIKSTDTRTFESLILEIWLQQWPRLRRSFSFCTGAIYPRNIAGKYFDLQVCPEKFERNVTLNSSALVVDPYNPWAGDSDPLWLNVACSDLESPSRLRLFLRRYGADVEGTREGFSKLLSIYIFINQRDQPNISDLVLVLSTIFPKQSDAETLKLDMLKGHHFDNVNYLHFSELDILFVLATTDRFASFNYDKLGFTDRFLSIYYNYDESSEAIKTLNRLLDNEINPFGELLLEHIAVNLTESQFENFANMFDKKLAFALATQNSQLLYSESFWKQYTADHEELLSILLRHKTGRNIDWDRIIDTLTAINFKLPRHIYGDFSNDLVTHVLHWLNSRNLTRLNQSWFDLLRNNPQTIIIWLNSTKEVSQNSLKIITHVLNPNSREVIAGGSYVWVNFIVGLNDTKDKDLQIQIAAFALALAFNRPDKYHLELLSRSFEIVYFAAKYDRLSYEYWQPIEVHTKPLRWLNDWDKCKKLIDALFTNFRDVKWMKSQIDVLFYTEEVRARVLHRYNKKFF